jgi:hypothetical protein
MTNVTVVAFPGAASSDPTCHPRSILAHGLKRTGSLTVAGARRALYRASFSGHPGKWTIEQVSFEENGYCWRLSLSYARRLKELRSLMLKMLESFKLTSGIANG